MEDPECSEVCYGTHPRKQRKASKKDEALTAEFSSRSRRKWRRGNRSIIYSSIDFPLLAGRLKGTVRVFRRKNGVWYVRFTLDGKRHMLSTYLSADKVDRDVALRKAYEVMLEVERKEKLGFPKKAVPTLATFAKRYLDFAEANKAPSTFKRDKNRLLKLVKNIRQTETQ